jgi:hypothetical protein
LEFAFPESNNKNEITSQALEVNAYNPSYLGGRDQGEWRFKASHHKKGLVEWLKV